MPPTAVIVTKFLGIRHLATRFGFPLPWHPVSGFPGAYAGGLALAKFGDYQWMWHVAMALATIAAVVNLRIGKPR